MIGELDALLRRYERREITRRDLLGALALATAAASETVAAYPQVGTVRQLNHVTVFVPDVQKSAQFYQRLFGMPLLTRQDPGVNLDAGSGFLGIYPAQNRRPGIDHLCLGLDRFDADAALEKLTEAGVKGSIRLRGDTKELYFTDPDGVRVQLQDVRYKGGVGPLGDRDPK
jgi:catechol 2,3-dioxygenase-like lactoylglutathione lyase family enzyme